MFVLAHVGPVPVEELLPGAVIAFAFGVPALRARARAIRMRRRRAGAKR